MDRPVILGIESSCDETAAALVDGSGRVLGHALLSQADRHSAFGGVVPEIAARAHVEALDRLIGATLEEAGLGIDEIDAVAATAGPGLIGGLLVGLVTGKAIAYGAGKPFLAINHLEGHALSPRLMDDLPFPYLLLLVSGGHCQLLLIEGVGRYRRLGSTIDDAAGEAFDKTAKLLGLGYPGGPALARAAEAGDPRRFDLPRPFLGADNCNFSFSGLKSAVRRTAEELVHRHGALSARDVADLAAATEAAIVDCLIDRTERAIGRTLAQGPASPHLVVAGGVAANRALRDRLHALSKAHGLRFVAPPLWLCTDNAAMIAWAGIERFRLGLVDDFSAPARPRWPLDSDAEPLIGAGRKGAKA
ncbi:MAG: tRNA (adenosine(37)-N6)-threonylcarbamoyltransferase complex transferase subunit TsaD [Rhodothalassiaceae bacterium]